MVHLGDQLEASNNYRNRDIEAKDLMEIMTEFGSKAKPSRSEFTDPTRVSERENYPSSSIGMSPNGIEMSPGDLGNCPPANFIVFPLHRSQRQLISSTNSVYLPTNFLRMSSE